MYSTNDTFSHQCCNKVLMSDVYPVFDDNMLCEMCAVMPQTLYYLLCAYALCM